MKNLLYFFLAAFSSTGYSQDLIFEDLPDIPVDYISLLTTSDFGNSQIYINCGFSNPQVDDLMYYDTITEDWNTLETSEPLLTPLVYANGEVMELQESLYRFNGSLNGELNDKLEIIDLNTGEVSFGAINPVPRRAAGSAQRNNDIYVFGGCVDPSNQGVPQSYTGDLYYYNYDFDSWTQLASMPNPRETRGEIVGNKLYAVGGYNGDVSNKIDVYNISTNQWENQFVMPFSVSAQAMTVSGSIIFIVGDYVELERIAYFDVENETFVNLTQSNFIGRRHSDVDIIDNKLYITGGNNASGSSNYLNSLQRADLGGILSSNSFEESLKFTITPNPTSDIIRLPQTFNEIYSYEIFDGSGKIIVSKSSQNNREILLDSLPLGTYFLHIKMSSFSKTFKIIKI